MAILKAKFSAILEDVNKENGTIVRLFGKITDSLFNLIKWGGIPLVVYLFIAISGW